MTKRKLRKQKKSGTSSKASQKPRCGLCGKTENLTKTECCGQWICDDEDQYVMFSFARNSCWRNHRRFTLCGYHYVGTKATGKSVKSAEAALKQKCMSTTEPMNTISRSSRTLLNISQRSAHRVEK